MSEKKKPGKPLYFSTEEEQRKLKNLMRLCPTLEDTAAFFECGTRTIEQRIREIWDVTFREFREQNMVHTRLNIKRAAIQKAEAGDKTMLIFLLKNWCGMKDKIEHSGDNQEPIVLNYSIDSPNDSGKTKN